MELNHILQEHISPMDFVGLVRCIAAFEGIGGLETDLEIRPEYAAWVYRNKKSECFEICGSISRLFSKQPLELLQVAAHEVGHIMSDHLGWTPKKILMSIFRPMVLWEREELEADEWAKSYAYPEGWRTSYRRWDLIDPHLSK